MHTIIFLQPSLHLFPKGDYPSATGLLGRIRCQPTTTFRARPPHPLVVRVQLHCDVTWFSDTDMLCPTPYSFLILFAQIR